MVEVKGLVETEDLLEIFSHLINIKKDSITCVEVGVFTGKSICILSQFLKENNKNSIIYGIDDWSCTYISEETKDFIGVRNNFEQKFLENLLLCDVHNVNIVKKKSLEAVNDFVDNSIDFLFLDGDHTYPNTKNELLAWLPKMYKKGIIAGHDYPSDSIKMTVNEVLYEYKINIIKSNSSYWVQL